MLNTGERNRHWYRKYVWQELLLYNVWLDNRCNCTFYIHLESYKINSETKMFCMVLSIFDKFVQMQIWIIQSVRYLNYDVLCVDEAWKKNNVETFIISDSDFIIYTFVLI